MTEFQGYVLIGMVSFFGTFIASAILALAARRPDK
jgi:hypothetical protein